MKTNYIIVCAGPKVFRNIKKKKKNRQQYNTTIDSLTKTIFSGIYTTPAVLRLKTAISRPKLQ